MASKPLSIGPFPQGMNNRLPDSQLKLSKEEGGGQLLRDALNVDITARGTLKRRQGAALAHAGLNCHSGWAPRGGAYMLYADAGDLFRLDVKADGTALREQIAAGYGRATPVVFSEVNEAVYFTDGLRVGSYHPVPGPTPQWLGTAPRLVADVQFSAMPAGSCIAHQGARLLVAVGSALIYSEPFTPNLRDESRGFEIFPGEITGIAAVEGGVFVLADKTYFLPGGLPVTSSMRAVLPYGAVRGTVGYLPGDDGAFWMSQRGAVEASPDGTVRNLQEKHLALAATGQGAMFFRESDGIRQLITSLSEPDESRAGVGSYMQARIVKKDDQ